MSTSANRISLNKGYTENGFAEKVFHLHIRLKNDKDEIYFRDYLNAHADIAKEYEQLKLKLWKTYEHARDAYTAAKTEFVKKYTESAKQQLRKRPNFKDIKSYDEFVKYYWYLDELKAICKSLGLEYVGGKIELNNIIKAYFDGVTIAHKPRPKVKSTTNTLTLDTSLVECGFTFGPRFRDFYIQVTDDKNFKFTADMVATAKAVKANNDATFTLGDLLDVKLGKKTYAKYDNSSCQWNKFLKDFCADEANNIFPDKLTAASRFWALLRSSDLPKVYSREFIEHNKDNVKI
ncbi:MAG: GrpB family protein [Clostridiales bacterium]|nr:GrpB family protein [Clostridiales bacterium]